MTSTDKWGSEDLKKIDSQEVEKIIGQDTFWEAPSLNDFPSTGL